MPVSISHLRGLAEKALQARKQYEAGAHIDVCDEHDQALSEAMHPDEETILALLRVVEAAKAAREFLDDLCGRMATASCETQDAPCAAWEDGVNVVMFDGLMASHTYDLEEALEAFEP